MREQLVDQGSQLDNLLSEEFFYISQMAVTTRLNFSGWKISEKVQKFELISSATNQAYPLSNWWRSSQASGDVTKTGKISSTSRNQKGD